MFEFLKENDIVLENSTYSSEGEEYLSKNKFVKQAMPHDDEEKPRRAPKKAYDKPAAAKKPAAPRKRKVGTEDVAAE